MAKGRNNLLGVGGQRRKLSRADQRGDGPAGRADRLAAAEQKQELLRRMRERALHNPDAEASHSEATRDEGGARD
ncbi:hypothetical protein SSP531S_15560 [Streptomyces spongiicola]|uniref:Uncharacterized protein n=1 Tax=Streptomyces spongiicola TaxID=1690221 RepID=A0A2S1YWU2_9ACTN|nr:DUF6243 family protein [Streptomyces spongiicola]AWK08577.1 hypothetical protein DDQ41_06170 [Streptomyces spongiicola]GBQ00146.1 hypothetical protein SSP531S_15560 [Streptomyces spongiicola]